MFTHTHSLDSPVEDSLSMSNLPVTWRLQVYLAKFRDPNTLEYEVEEDEYDGIFEIVWPKEQNEFDGNFEPPTVHAIYNMIHDRAICDLNVTYKKDAPVGDIMGALLQHTPLIRDVSNTIADILSEPLSITAFGSLCETWNPTTNEFEMEPSIPLEVRFTRNSWISIVDPRSGHEGIGFPYGYCVPF